MPSCRIAGLLILFSTTYSVGQTATSVPCLSYEPVVVKIAGTLGRKTEPGPPNYENIRNGDRPETYWFVKLSRPVCVGEDEKEPALNPAKKNVGSIQLVLAPAAYAACKELVGKKVVASGTLLGAITGHHHTPVLLTVRTLSAVNPELERDLRRGLNSNAQSARAGNLPKIGFKNLPRRRKTLNPAHLIGSIRDL